MVPPPHNHCLVDRDGHSVNDSERAYDNVGPVIGRLREPAAVEADCYKPVMATWIGK